MMVKIPNGLCNRVEGKLVNGCFKGVRQILREIGFNGSQDLESDRRTQNRTELNVTKEMASNIFFL